MAGLQKTWSGDLTTSVAKRLMEAQQLASAGKKQAMGVADHYGVDPMLRRGEFLGHGLGASFSQFLPRQFQHNMPNVTRRDPSYIARGQRSNALYGQSSPLPSSAIVPSSPIIPNGGGGGLSQGQMARRDPMLKARMINERGGNAEIKVHDEKLGTFVSEVGQSLSGTMNVLNTDNDAIKEGMFSAQEGLTVTQDQLENVGDTLEDKLDAIINEIRTQNDLIRRSEDQKEASLTETQIEQANLPNISPTARIAGVNEDARAVLRENQAEDAAYDNNLSPMRKPGEYESGTNWLHGKETDDLGRVFDGPDTGYLANTAGASSITPINNFFTRGQTGAASKTGGSPSGMNPVKGKAQDLADIPEVKAETEKLGKAVLVPVKAAGAMTLGILGKAFSNIPMIGPVAGAIKQIASPIASMFGVKNSVATNLAQEVGDKEDEQQRQADTASHSSKSKNEKKNWFSRSVDWIKNIFNNNKSAEKGTVIKSNVSLSSVRPTSNFGSSNVSMSAEKGATVINGPKTGYNVNVGGTEINAHGKELVTSAEKGVQITPLDNFATDGIQGNEVTPGGDIAHKMSFERGGIFNKARAQRLAAQKAAMNAPQSNKSAIVQLNSKEREFKRMLIRTSKVEPIVINSKNAKSTPSPQEMNHITNVGDPGLDVIYPSLV